MSGDSRKREGPDPSRYLRNRSRSIDTTLSQPTTPENVITEQPTQAKVRPRSGYHLESRPARSGDDLDNEWEILDTVDSRSTEDSSVNKDFKSQRTDSTVSTDSNTALDEALAECQQLRDKYAHLLRRLSDQEKKSKRLQEQLVEKDEEVNQLHAELTASRGPSSDVSTGNFQTPPSSLSQLEQQDRSRLEGQSELVMYLQTDNQAKGEEISKLTKEVTQLKRRLDYAEDIEKQNTQLATAVSVHEEEKKKLQKQIQQLQQSLHHDEAGIQLECDTLKREISNLQSQVEESRRYESENARLRERLTAAEKELRGPITHIDDTDVDETKKLKEALQEKELHIQHLQRQLESYRKTAAEFGELQQHSKKQSQHVMQLRSHVDAARVEKEEHTEFERSLMESLHSLEEQNEKLMADYQAVSKDRGYMEENLRTLKKTHEELISKLQQCEAQIGVLSQQEESARKQQKSISDDYRAVCLKNQELLKEKQQLEADNSQFITNMKKLTDMANENATLQRNIIAMRKEKEELWNELQLAKAESQLYKEDFDHEREDRAKAHSQIDEIRTELTTKLEEARTELQQVEADRDHHKETLAQVEAVNKRKEGELRKRAEEALAAREEVQAKTSQVKQYKKQVDSLKAQMAETQQHNIDLIQEMEKVRLELVKTKGKIEKGSKKDAEKEEKKQKKKQSADKVPAAATSPMAQPPLGWESRVAELERMNEQLRNDNDKLRRENEVALAHQKSRSPVVEGYGQDQQQIMRQLQKGFQQQQQLQQQPYTEEHTAGAGRLTSLSSGPSSLSEAMHRQPIPLQAKILPPNSLVVQPHASRNSEVAPYSDPNPAISPTSHPYHNWPPSSGAGNLPVQQPGAKAFTDSHMITAHHLAKEQFHSAYPATDSNPTIPPQNVAHQRHIHPQPPSYQRQRSGSGSSPQGQQQQQLYIAKADPLMQHIDTDIHDVVAQVSEGRTHQATMQHIPYDPNLVCAYCNKQFRMGEIQKYKHHVGICHGSGESEV